MRIINHEEMKAQLFDHPYNNSLDYHAAMSVVYLSHDKKLLIGYWTAPEGKVSIRYGENIEHNYIIREKISVHCQDGTILTAVPGDVIECSGQDVVYDIEEYAETLFIVYPQEKEDVDFLEKIQEINGKVNFPVNLF